MNEYGAYLDVCLGAKSPMSGGQNDAAINSYFRFSAIQVVTFPPSPVGVSWYCLSGQTSPVNMIWSNNMI